MYYERAIDLQRDALLRLLARLVVAVEIMSCALLVDRAPYWARAFVSSILFRAEIAAEYLVIASMRALLPHDFRSGEMSNLARSALSSVRNRRDCAENLRLQDEDGISCDGLMARIQALKDLLENLPRAAMRRLRHELGVEAHSAALPAGETAFGKMFTGAAFFMMAQVFAPRIERPPDKV